MNPLLLFTLAAAALVVAALAFVLPALLRARARRDDALRAEINADLYRRDLDELRAEVARGELPPEELQAARAELQRRLDAGRAAPAGGPSRGRIAAVLLAVALPLAAAAIYLAVGKPAAIDDAEAPAAVEKGADYVERLQSHLRRQPRDGRGWVLLARAQAERNAFADAVASFERALAATPKIAKDPMVLCEFADALGMAQGGRLAGRPADLIAQALAIDPQHPVALEMAGSAAYEDGRFAEAARHWKQLLSQLAPESDRHAELAAAVARAERRAAVTLPR